MEEILILASSYGFPMVVAIYLLVRLEPIIRSLKESVDSLSLIIAMQNDYSKNEYEKIRALLKDD
ncbi:MAG: YvrJ family protein [Bacillota bacterium]